MTEIARRYRTLATELTRRIDAVPAARWDDPSPCPGWTAKDVVRHVVDTHRAMPGYAGLSLALKRNVDADPAGAWVEARDQMQALLDDPARADKDYDGYFGRTTLAATVDRFLGLDLLIHGWDLARATGQEETLPADEVHRVYTDALGLGENLRMEGVCGPAVRSPTTPLSRTACWACWAVRPRRAQPASAGRSARSAGRPVSAVGRSVRSAGQ